MMTLLFLVLLAGWLAGLLARPAVARAGLEAVLRSLTTFAALTEATLEVNAVVNVPPRVASPRALEGLARDLWEAGFPVRFAPSWTPAPAADVYLGVGGDEELDEFVRSQAWWGRI